MLPSSGRFTQGYLYSLDNRRLALFRLLHFAGVVQKIKVRAVDKTLSRSLCLSHTSSPSSLPSPASRGAASVAQPRAQPRSCGTARRSGYCTAGNPVFGFGYLRVHSHSVGLISLTIRWRECSGQCHCALPFWHQSHHFKHKGCNDDPLYRQLCIVLRHCDPQLNSHAQRTRSVQWAFPLSSYVNGSL